MPSFTPPRPFTKIPVNFSAGAQKLMTEAVWRGEQRMLIALYGTEVLVTSKVWLERMSEMLDGIARRPKLKRMFYDYVSKAMTSFRPYHKMLESARKLLWLNLYATKKMIRDESKRKQTAAWKKLKRKYGHAARRR